MIVSFGDKETEKIWNGFRSAKLPNEIQQIAIRKLRMINNSQEINDLRILPANRMKNFQVIYLGFTVSGLIFSRESYFVGKKEIVMKFKL
jgi:proteic killer suppression protein